MYYYYFLCTLSLAGALGTTIGCHLFWPWALLLFVLYWLGILVLHFGFVALATLFFDPDKPVERITPSFYRFFLHHSCMVALKLLRVRIHLEGKEYLPKSRKEPVLFVCNHLSHFDPMIVTWLLYHRGILFVTKPENFYLPLVGRYIRRSGFIAIDRVSPRSAMKAIQLTAKRLTEKCTVCVFPEGTISRSMNLLGFHDGVFLAAQKAKVPVAIGTLRNTQYIKHNWLKWGTDVYIKVEGIIPAEEVTSMRCAELSARARELMRPTIISAGFQAPPADEAEVFDLSTLVHQSADKPEDTHST